MSGAQIVYSVHPGLNKIQILFLVLFLLLLLLLFITPVNLLLFPCIYMELVLLSFQLPSPNKILNC